jgi:aspartyl/glutamyl-tRNA(Asn/Gln) amidotransferase C subunit
MATKDDVRKLAELARLSIADEELERFAKEFDSILAYIGKIESLNVSAHSGGGNPPLRNVFREDGEPHEKGTYTKKLVEQFPQKDGNYLSVKQIISYD